MRKTLFSFLCIAALVQAQENSLYQIVEDQAKLPILTPALEGRKIEKLILQNGMHVYLVYDPGTEQSGAALCVETGSWDDPKEYPGMAHFLEHMLFMGTAAYPKEFEYMQYVTDHGGKVNAYTAPDRTVYMFSVNNDAFKSTLDRFAHFFIDPLLSPSCIARELQAVDQEHAKNLEHDGWRHYMILKETSNPDHPQALFSTGNAKTLSKIPQEELKRWYESHYNASRMHLALLTPIPLEQMRECVLASFSQVRDFTPLEKQLPASVCSTKQCGSMFFIKPVKELRQLSLSWEIPRQFATDIDRQAPALIAYALNKEGEGTLIHWLKSQKIAESLHVDCDRLSKNTQFLSIDITLTEQGLSHIDQTVQSVYEALARLKEEGYPRYLFDEMQTMARLNYQYQSRDDAFMSIMQYASEMPYESLATYPEKTTIPTTFDASFIAQFLSTLEPSRCIYSVVADPTKTGIAPNKKERWMQAEYAVKKVSSSYLTSFAAAKPHPQIHLPAPNPYLPENVALIAQQGPIYGVDSPLLIRKDDTGTVYYAQDMRYKVPQAVYMYTLKSPLIDHSSSSQALLDLYARALSEKISSSCSTAAAAGLKSKIAVDKLSLKIIVDGYNDKASLLLHTIFTTMTHPLCSKEEFEIYKTSLIDEYRNTTKDLPVLQAMTQIDQLLLNMPAHEEKETSLRALSFETFSEFATQFSTRLYTQALLYGNISEAEARRTDASLTALLQSTPYPVASQLKEKILLLSDTYRPRKIVQATQRQGNGALLLLQEWPYSFEKRGIQQVLSTALQDAFFDTLRTKQQTGYYVRAWAKEEQRQLLQYFAVQSSTHSSTDLLARFELFLEDFDKNLTEMIPQERFASLKDNLITLLSMPPENMSHMALQLNLFAFDYEDFRWLEKRIASLKSLTYERFCEVAHTFLSRSNNRRLAVLINGVLPPENDFKYDHISKEEVLQLGTFLSIN